MNTILRDDLTYITKNLKKEIPLLKNTHLLITGATGFFGKNILEFLLHLNQVHQANIKVYVLTRNKTFFLKNYPQFQHPSFYFIKGNVISFKTPSTKIDYIVHAAGETTNLATTNELEIINTAYQGTKAVLEIAKIKKVKSILLVSSGGIYGEQPKNLAQLPENFTIAPNVYALNSCYGEGKRLAEYVGNYYAQKFETPVKIARCFSFIGPYMPLNAHFAAGNFIKNALSNQAITIKGNGKSTRSFLYTADLVCWLFKCLLHGKNNTPYNIGSGDEVNIQQLAQEIAKNFKPSPAVKVLNQNIQQSRYIPNPDKAIKELKIKSYISFEMAVKRTAEYFKFEQHA